MLLLYILYVYRSSWSCGSQFYYGRIVCIAKSCCATETIKNAHCSLSTVSDHIKQTLQLLDKITIELTVKFNGVVTEYDLI